MILVTATRLDTGEYREGKAVVNSIEERGRVFGLRKAVRKVLEKKFGTPGPETIRQIDAFPVVKLEELLPAIFDANSLAELGLADSPTAG